MELKKIFLQNIRSYKKQEIEFPEGSVLLAGDIGSGKTSVLLAIEFALFGLQPGQRGSSLLRNGEKQGRVIIEFEIEGKQVLIERTLRRAKTISQDYCAVTVEGSKHELSVTELKNVVLDLLNYPKEFSKKQNVLYKFTVYTPQEEMKQIILQDSITRLNTLRHVFGVDKYKTILENTAIVISKLKEEIRIKEALTETLEQDKIILNEKQNELEIKKDNLITLEGELLIKTENRKMLEEQKNEIAKKIEEKSKLQQEIEKTNIITANKKESISGNFKLSEQLKSQITELLELKFDESKISQLEQEISLLKTKKNGIDEKNLQVITQINSLSLKNQENEFIKAKLSKLELCPTCLQNVAPTYKANVINKLDSEILQNSRKIQELTLERKILTGELIKINLEISSKEKQIQELNILRIKFQGIQEKQKNLEEVERNTLALQKDIELLNQHIEILKKSIFELKKFDNLSEQKQKQLENALQQEKQAEIKIAELKKEIDVFSLQIAELKNKVQKTEELKNQLQYLAQLEDWLSKKFTIVISHIEKNVMVKLKTDFSKLFAEWFSMLVSDSFNIQLDEEFTPVIEQQDYELSYSYLSGGERTAIALSYRLALNQVINSLLSKIKTRDLVILDEPTDGFSEQQLEKMRDVLQQLNVKQLIIVSHEQKIETFVDNVIRFRKQNGISIMEE